MGRAGVDVGHVGRAGPRGGAPGGRARPVGGGQSQGRRPAPERPLEADFPRLQRTSALGLATGCDGLVRASALVPGSVVGGISSFLSLGQGSAVIRTRLSGPAGGRRGLRQGQRERPPRCQGQGSGSLARAPPPRRVAGSGSGSGPASAHGNRAGGRCVRVCARGGVGQTTLFVLKKPFYCESLLSWRKADGALSRDGLKKRSDSSERRAAQAVAQGTPTGSEPSTEPRRGRVARPRVAPGPGPDAECRTKGGSEKRPRPPRAEKQMCVWAGRARARLVRGCGGGRQDGRPATPQPRDGGSPGPAPWWHPVPEGPGGPGTRGPGGTRSRGEAAATLVT